MLSAEEELEIACLIEMGTHCRGLILLKKTLEQLKKEQAKSKDLQDWMAVLHKQIERYEK